MKRFLLLCLTTLFALTTWAYDFYDETSELYYNFVDGGVEVTCPDENSNDSYYETESDVNIPETVVYGGKEYTVVGVGDYAFYPSKNVCRITSLTLPNTLTYIGKYAFDGALNYSKLSTRSIVIPDGVKTIDDYAFDHSGEVLSFTIGESVESIGDYAFARCFPLTEIVIPDACKTIGDGGFCDDDQLTFISLGASLESIGEESFTCYEDYVVYSYNTTPPSCASWNFDYTDGAELYVPIESYDLYASTSPWSSFPSIIGMGTIPPTATTLEATDIWQNTATLHASYEKGSEEITGQGFEYWPSSNSSQVQTIEASEISEDEMSVTVESLSPNTTYVYRAYVATESATSRGETLSFNTAVDYSFESDGIYYNITSTNSRTCAVTYLFYDSEQNCDTYSGNIVIPSEVDIDGITYTVTSIANCAFNYCDKLLSVELPETITSIGSYAFELCTSLESINLPSSLTSLNAYAFYYCESLKEITVPSSITSINTAVFGSCTSLTSVELLGNVTSIGQNAFAYCESLEEITLPSTVRTLGINAFYYCYSLKSIEIPDGVSSIEQGTFCHCESLESVVFPSALTSIGGMDAFSYCYSLKEINLPETLKTIGEDAFYRCESLETIVIPDNVTTIKRDAFAYCYGLTSVKIGKGVEELNTHAFYFDTALEEVTFDEENTLTAMGNSAFSTCRSLRKVNIPKTVTTMGTGVFYYCDVLPEITLPSGLTEIDFNSFTCCYELRKIYTLNPEPPVCGYHSGSDRGVFTYVDLDACTLYVPVGSYEAYRTAYQWEDFMNVVEMVGVETLDAGDVTASSAVLNGKITIGEYSMDVTKEGFEFWKDGLDNVITTIGIEESEMSYTITNLDSETTYTYRAFATTEDGTTYGENVSFTTAEDTSTGIDNVGMSGINGENVEGIYSTSGQKLNTTVKGVNIIRYTDGTTKKVLVK